MSESHERPDPDPDNDTAVDDRRKSERQGVHGSLRVFLETTEFGGQSKNFSPAGVYFFSSDELRVRVEVGEGDNQHVFHGSLARVARLSDTETGYAIEFDRE
jgi:hypothetical protein